MTLDQTVMTGNSSQRQTSVGLRRAFKVNEYRIVDLGMIRVIHSTLCDR